MTEGKPPHALLRPSIALPFLLISLIWGSTWIVIKDQLGAAPESWSVTYRFAVAAAGMFVVALAAERRLRLSPGGQPLAMAVGLAQFCLNFNFVYRAETHITSGIVAVLFALLMLPNAVFGRIFLGQTITRRFMLGTGIALGGIALLLVNEARMAPLGGEVGYGIALTVIAILSASAANILQASAAARRQPLMLLIAWAMLWGTVFDAAFAWATVGPPVIPSSARYWGGVAYLAIIGSVIAFPLYFRLIRQLGPGRAAYNGVVVPVVAMAISTLLEGYRWSALALAGGALAMIGLVVALRGREAPVSEGKP